MIFDVFFINLSIEEYFRLKISLFEKKLLTKISGELIAYFC